MEAQVENAFWRKKVEGAGRTVKMMPMSKHMMKSRTSWKMRIRNNKFPSQCPCSEETEHQRRNGQCYFWRLTHSWPRCPGGSQPQHSEEVSMRERVFHVAKEERQSLLPGDKLRSRRGTFILWRDVDLVDGALTAEAMGWMVVAERKCLAWLL